MSRVVAPRSMNAIASPMRSFGSAENGHAANLTQPVNV
jgi:hypothetical protein